MCDSETGPAAPGAGDESCTECSSNDAVDIPDPSPPASTPPESSTIDFRLPAELRTALGRFVGRESVETLAEWVSVVRRHTGGGSISTEDLCRTTDETAHWGVLDDERHYFLCFYDAVILAALEHRPVEIHTESPDGTSIEVRADGTDELDATPEEAVFSFGISDDADSIADGDPTLQDAYEAVCPYVNAFPNRAHYEQWAETVPASTVAIPLAGATDVAAALVR